jgi:hypothetical protein
MKDEGSGEEERKIASLLVYAGGIGSVALIGANLCGISMFARPTLYGIDGNGPSAWLFLPVLLLDVLLLLPRPHGKDGLVVKGLLKDLDASSPSFEAQLSSTLTLYQIVATGAGFKQAAPFNLGKEAALSVLRDTTREMLQRGFLLHLIARGLQEVSDHFGIDWLNSDHSAAIAGVLMTIVLLPPVLSESRAAKIFTARGLATVRSLQTTDEDGMDDLMKEWRLVKELEKAPSEFQAQTAYNLTLLRGVLRFATLNAVFVTSRFDLFSSLLLAIASDVLLLFYCKLGRDDLPTIFDDQKTK